MRAIIDPHIWMVVGVILGWVLGVGTMALLAWIDRRIVEGGPGDPGRRTGPVALCGADEVTNQLCPHAPTEYAGFCQCLTCNGCGWIDDHAACPTCDGRGILP